MAALVQEAGEDVLRQQADVFGEHSDDVLENEAAGAHAVSDTKDERVKGVGDVSCGFTRDLDPVVAEEGLKSTREKEVQRSVALGQIGDGHPVNRFIELGVEVVDPELVEVAEHYVGRAVGDEAELVSPGQ